jgi:MFS family permease
VPTANTAETPEQARGPDEVRVRDATRVRLLYGYSFLFTFNIWLPFLVVFLLGRGLDLSQIGAVQAAGWLGVAAAQFPAGAAADRFGHVKVLFFAPLLLATSLIGLVVLPVGWPLLLAQFVGGLGLACFLGPYYSLLFKVLDEEGRADEYGRIAGMGLGLSFAANVPAGFVGAALIGVGFGVGATLIAHAAVLVVAAAVLLLVREPAASGRRSGWSPVPVWRTLRNPRIGLLLVLSALSNAPFHIGYALSQPYVLLLGLPVWVLGPLESVRAITAGVVSALTGRIPQKYAKLALVIAQAALGVAFISLAAVVGIHALIVFPIIAAAGASAFVIQKTLLNQQTEIAERATINSAQSFVSTVTVAASLWAVLTLAAHIGILSALAWTAVFFAAAFALTFALWSRVSAAR